VVVFDMNTIVDKALLISKYAQEWLRINNRTEAKPGELMPYLIEKGVFKSDHRNGLPLRNVLRELEKRDMLHLIQGAEYEPKQKNKMWYIRLMDN
jgi:hypothetical protein